MLETQSCPTLCDTMDCSPPGSSVHGILQARILEWVAIPFSRGSSWPRNRTHIPCIASGFFTFWATLNWTELNWSRSVVSNSLRPRGLYPTRLLHPRDSLGKNTGVGCHSLLQGIFPIQGTHVSCTGRQILYHWATREAHSLIILAYIKNGWK